MLESKARVPVQAITVAVTTVARSYSPAAGQGKYGLAADQPPVKPRLSCHQRPHGRKSRDSLY